MKFKSANSEIRKSTIDSKLFSSSLHIKSTRKDSGEISPEYFVYATNE